MQRLVQWETQITVKIIDDAFDCKTTAGIALTPEIPKDQFFFVFPDLSDDDI